MGLRQTLDEKPWIGGVVVALLIAAAVALYIVRRPGGGAESQARLLENITIRCSETGQEWEIPRGKMVSGLRGASANARLDPSIGLVNPTTKKPTGFPVDRDEWTALIERLNKEREAYNKSRGIAAPGA